MPDLTVPFQPDLFLALPNVLVQISFEDERWQINGRRQHNAIDATLTCLDKNQ